MLLSRQRGGKPWFAFEAKSFDIEVEDVSKGLRGCIWERRKGVTSWIKFKGHNLTRSLMGLEACVRASSVPVWGNAWEEEGRRYIMEKGSNQAGSFIRCLVRDLVGKSYNLMFPEGKGVVGGWRILAEKLRQLGVRSNEETQREEKFEKSQKEEKQRKSSTKPLPRLLKLTPRSFVEILKTKKTPLGKGVCVNVREDKVRERLDQLDRCLVGWWG